MHLLTAKKIAMVDSDFTYVKYNNFPEHYLKEIFDMSLDYIPEGFFGVEAKDVSKELILDMQLENLGKYIITIEDIQFGLNVYISPPAEKMFDVHIDRSRKMGVNFPIQVDPEKGYLLVMKDDNYDALGEPVNEPPNIRFGDKFLRKDRPGHKKWVNVDESAMEKVKMDKPVMLNTARPHSYVNYSNQFRIIASLNTSQTAQQVYESFKLFL